MGEGTPCGYPERYLVPSLWRQLHLAGAALFAFDFRGECNPGCFQNIGKSFEISGGHAGEEMNLSVVVETRNPEETGILDSGGLDV